MVRRLVEKILREIIWFGRFGFLKNWISVSIVLILMMVIVM